MKYTLLDLTQTVLASAGSDEVNSIGDTVESRQVATIIRTVYFDMVARAGLPKSKNIYSLDASADDDLPVLMYKPTNAYTLEWLKYDISEEEVSPKRPDYRDVKILPIKQFLDMVNRIGSNDTDVESFVLEDFTFYYNTDRFPTYCTILNNRLVIFDSINLEFDTTLQSDKTMAYGQLHPTFTMEDDFVPDLDDEQFNLLLNQAKILAFAELKQTTHDVALLESRRQWRNVQKTKNFNKGNPMNDFAYFGRL